MKLNKKYQIDNVSIDEISNETVQFLNDIKMEFAKKLLLNTDFSIGEIARKIGYDDQGHFGRNFKKFILIWSDYYEKTRKTY